MRTAFGLSRESRLPKEKPSGLLSLPFGASAILQRKQGRPAPLAFSLQRTPFSREQSLPLDSAALAGASQLCALGHLRDRLLAHQPPLGRGLRLATASKALGEAAEERAAETSRAARFSRVVLAPHGDSSDAREGRLQQMRLFLQKDRPADRRLALAQQQEAQQTRGPSHGLFSLKKTSHASSNTATSLWQRSLLPDSLEARRQMRCSEAKPEPRATLGGHKLDLADCSIRLSPRGSMPQTKFDECKTSKKWRIKTSDINAPTLKTDCNTKSVLETQLKQKFQVWVNLMEHSWEETEKPIENASKQRDGESEELEAPKRLRDLIERSISPIRGCSAHILGESVKIRINLATH